MAGARYAEQRAVIISQSIIHDCVFRRIAVTLDSVFGIEHRLAYDALSIVPVIYIKRRER